jgi:hypothetical protein
MKKTNFAVRLKRTLQAGLLLGILSLGFSSTGCSAEMTQTLTSALTSVTSSVLDAVVNNLVTTSTSTN